MKGAGDAEATATRTILITLGYLPVYVAPEGAGKSVYYGNFKDRESAQYFVHRLNSDGIKSESIVKSKRGELPPGAETFPLAPPEAAVFPISSRTQNLTFEQRELIANLMAKQVLARQPSGRANFDELAALRLRIHESGPNADVVLRRLDEFDAPRASELEGDRIASAILLKDADTLIKLREFDEGRAKLEAILKIDPLNQLAAQRLRGVDGLHTEIDLDGGNYRVLVLQRRSATEARDYRLMLEGLGYLPVFVLRDPPGQSVCCGAFSDQADAVKMMAKLRRDGIQPDSIVNLKIDPSAVVEPPSADDIARMRKPLSPEQQAMIDEWLAKRASSTSPANRKLSDEIQELRRRLLASGATADQIDREIDKIECDRGISCGIRVSISSLFYESDSLCKQKMYDEAIATLREILRIDPQNSIAKLRISAIESLLKPDAKPQSEPRNSPPSGQTP